MARSTGDSDKSGWLVSGSRNQLDNGHDQLVVAASQRLVASCDGDLVNSHLL